MGIHVTKNRIRATGTDANALFIAMMTYEQLIEAEAKQTGSDDFRRMIKEAIAARKPKEAA
jgi:hypothetical protein